MLLLISSMLSFRPTMPTTLGVHSPGEGPYFIHGHQQVIGGFLQQLILLIRCIACNADKQARTDEQLIDIIMQFCADHITFMLLCLDRCLADLLLYLNLFFQQFVLEPFSFP